MPTSAECQELLSKTASSSGTSNGVKCAFFKKNGKTLTIPIGGSYNSEGKLSGKGTNLYTPLSSYAGDSGSCYYIGNRSDRDSFLMLSMSRKLYAVNIRGVFKK